MTRGTFENSSGFTQLCILFLFFIVGTFICIIPLGIMAVLNNGSNDINSIKLGIFFQDIFVFIFAPLTAQIFLWKESTRKNLCFHTPRLPILLWAILATIAISPLIDILNTWNQGLHLPESMKVIEDWMINSEKSADLIFKQILNATTWGGFLSNLFLIAIMAGISEELLFRGVLQKILIYWTRNVHWGILLTAIIFSAIHLQFFGFFPRMALGILLGYLYFYSKSIWVPIIAHAVNNGLTLVLTPCTFNKGNKVIETISKTENNIGFILVGIVLLSLSMWKIWTYHHKQVE